MEWFFRTVFQVPEPQVETKAELWDPENSPDWDNEKTDQSYKKALPRIKRDIEEVLTNPPVGSLVEVDERINDLSVVHALLTGPEDTPYEGGFFHFLLRFPANYPHQPPRVKFLTTGGGNVSFNPNLYPNGKVCINVIGTWGASAWTPAQCLFTVLEAIRNVMNKTPYDNEPNLELPWIKKNKDHRKQYRDFIYHETLRVAVCQMMEEKEKLPQELQSKMETMFLKKFDFYMRRIKEKAKKHDGKEMMVTVYGHIRGHFNYKQIRVKLLEIKSKLDQRKREEQPASEMDQTEAGMEQLTIEDEQATDVKEEQTADVKELEQPASEMDQTEAGMEQLTIEEEQATDVKEEQTADNKEATAR
ncbi:ubiquitin-conjugating enzyme E2 Z-like [Apostichopus japonicus]|uniref:ubiquitin-conjugating enzyme E2 Z-like n=1 Tax=Stichopus japonicus TaxID=307972 RepID=UPI003AB470FF